MVAEELDPFLDLLSVWVTGGLSAISSLLILFFVLRSKDGLSTIYHRIMFGLACAEFLGSLSMALTSVPLPRDLPDWDGYSYEEWYYGRWRFGNWQTCEAQGFFFIFGFYTALAYHGTLCVYYAFVLAFRYNETKIKKCIEPFMHIMCLFIGTSAASVPVLFQMYNPSISDAWCTIAPMGCEAISKKLLCDIRPIDTCLSSDSCYRGSEALEETLLPSLFVYTLSSIFGIIFVSMGLSFWRITSTGGTLETYAVIARKKSRRRGLPETDLLKRAVISAQQNSKVLMFQALAYNVTFLLSATFPLVREIIKGQNVIIERLFLTFLPLQGILTFAVFMAHKVYNYRLVHLVGRCEAIRLLFNGTADEPTHMIRIGMLRFNREHKVLFVEVHNEKGLVESLSCSLLHEDNLGYDDDFIGYDSRHSQRLNEDAADNYDDNDDMSDIDNEDLHSREMDEEEMLYSLSKKGEQSSRRISYIE